VLGELQPEVIEPVKNAPRGKVPVLGVEQRIDNFNPMEMGYGINQAVQEARRCLSCGPCKSCKGCVVLEFQTEISEIELDQD